MLPARDVGPVASRGRRLAALDALDAPARCGEVASDPFGRGVGPIEHEQPLHLARRSSVPGEGHRALDRARGDGHERAFPVGGDDAGQAHRAHPTCPGEPARSMIAASRRENAAPSRRASTSA